MSQPFSANTAGFIARIIECLPRILTGAEMQKMYEQPALLKRRLELALCPAEHTLWQTVVLPPRTEVELRNSVQSGPYTLNARDQASIGSLRFEQSLAPQTLELVRWTAEDLGIDLESNWNFGDVERRVTGFGLFVCTLEQALAVALALPAVRGDYFIPFNDAESIAKCGMLSVSKFRRRDSNTLHCDLTFYELGSPLYKFKSNGQTPCIFLKSVEGIDTAPMEAIFSEQLCYEFGYDSKVRTRVLSCLRNDATHTLKDLMGRTETELLRTPNLGKVGIGLIKKVLTHYNLTLPAR
jgi:hypothetical protein